MANAFVRMRRVVRLRVCVWLSRRFVYLTASLAGVVDVCTFGLLGARFFFSESGGTNKREATHCAARRAPRSSYIKRALAQRGTHRPTAPRATWVL
eukprot:5275887-Prymnesium_polylepis.1